MQSVRELLVEVTGSPEFATDIDGDLELSASGIDSGDLVRLVLLIERRTGVEVTAEDMGRLATIDDYQAFLAERVDPAAAGGA